MIGIRDAGWMVKAMKYLRLMDSRDSKVKSGSLHLQYKRTLTEELMII